MGRAARRGQLVPLQKSEAVCVITAQTLLNLATLALCTGLSMDIYTENNAALDAATFLVIGCCASHCSQI